MNTTRAQRDQKVESQAKGSQKGAEGLSITEGFEKVPETRKTSVIEMMFGTNMSVLCGEYDIPTLHLKPGAIVLDIGANEGAFSAWALFRWQECKVIAYEPCKATFERLQKAMSEQTRVELHRLAVTEREKPLLRYGANHHTENSIRDLGCQRFDGETVDTIKPFDLPFADFLKIDTEGCELEILSSYLNKHTPKGIALEWHSHEDRRELSKLLRAKGYKVSESPNVPVCINKGVYIGVMKGWME